MEIKLVGRVIPRNAKGDPYFERFSRGVSTYDKPGVLDVFNHDEVVELVNRALYQIEYQRESHKKRGAKQREQDKRVREALKAQGVDPAKAEIDKQLKGEE